MHLRHQAVAALTWVVLVLAGGGSALAQVSEDGWNDPAVTALVERAIERRSGEAVDTALQTYSARGRGFVYFLLDAPELDRQSLVRTDQVALEVYWRAPDQIRQRIVGLRERRDLPVTRLYYYLDRMTVVQDNYGQAIVIADGDNVSDVPHPIAAGARAAYDYRLADSLTLRLPGLPDPVRVREVQVRPRDATRPAVVGSVFLELETGALVRMAFTFTPSAYVDPRLDYINVTLENGLWQGRFWLPYEQRLEIRRELPELDLPFGTVIRTRMRVGEYQFNMPLPDWLFSGPPPITFVPEEQRRSFPFEEPIDAELRLEGIGPPADVEEIRREARAMLRERALSGLPRGRLGIGAASDVFRYNRAEGLALGAGIGIRPSAEAAGRLHAGWAFGAEHPVLKASLSGGTDVAMSLEGYVNRRADVGGSDPVSGLGNSLGALLFADDWTDPFYASGATATVATGLGPGHSITFTAAIERQRSATRTTTYSLFGSAADFRAVRPVDEGTRQGFSIGYRREPLDPTGGWTGGFDVGVAQLTGGSDFTTARVQGELGYSRSFAPRRAELELGARAGGIFGEPPVQELYLMGGRGTLPGWGYRAFAGDRWALATGLASAEIAHPWLRGRLLAGLGWTGFRTDAEAAAALWGVGDSGGAKASLGIGAGLFYDLLHVDLARGLGAGGRTQVIVEIQPDFWGML